VIAITVLVSEHQLTAVPSSLSRRHGQKQVSHVALSETSADPEEGICAALHIELKVIDHDFPTYQNCA